MLLPSEADCTDIVQSQGGQRIGLSGSAILAHPDLVLGANTRYDSPSQANISEEGLSFSRAGHNLALASRPLAPPPLALDGTWKT